MKVVVISVGYSKFSGRIDVTIARLTFEAFKLAMEDAGITPKMWSLVQKVR